MNQTELEIIPEKTFGTYKLDTCTSVYDFCDLDGKSVGLSDQYQHSRSNDFLRSRQ